MQGAGGRRFYARLLSYSGWHNRYGFLAVPRHTTDQKKTVMVMGFLASGNYFYDCFARCDWFYRTLDLSPFTSSLRDEFPPSHELQSNQKRLPLAEVAGYAERS
jgi:hypothetical protein